ncbi:MAG: ThiF family adenylyltransferase, partial [Thermoplasmata archaeon]|nr:ThiF family adenylyltransferase [Thermoplasmata archaeon]
MALGDAQVERYSRQIVLPEVGGRGQERLLAARIAVAGVGAAALTAVTLLGRAGVGAIDVAADMPALPE